MNVKDQHNITIENDDVLCDVNFLAPAGLTFTQTDQYDPNPRERITLREWHLKANTPSEQKQLEFVTLYRVHRENQIVPYQANLQKTPGGYVLDAKLSNGSVTALLPIDQTSQLRKDSMSTKGKIAVRVTQPNKPAMVVTED